MSLLKGKALDSSDWVTEVSTADGIASGVALGNTPVSGNLVNVYKNGVIQTPTIDYNLSGSTITFTSTPAAASELLIRYVRR